MNPTYRFGLGGIFLEWDAAAWSACWRWMSSGRNSWRKFYTIIATMGGLQRINSHNIARIPSSAGKTFEVQSKCLFKNEIYQQRRATVQHTFFDAIKHTLVMEAKQGSCWQNDGLFHRCRDQSIWSLEDWDILPLTLEFPFSERFGER